MAHHLRNIPQDVFESSYDHPGASYGRHSSLAKDAETGRASKTKGRRDATEEEIQAEVAAFLERWN